MRTKSTKQGLKPVKEKALEELFPKLGGCLIHLPCLFWSPSKLNIARPPTGAPSYVPPYILKN